MSIFLTVVAGFFLFSLWISISTWIADLVSDVVGEALGAPTFVALVLGVPFGLVALAAA